MKTHLHVWIHRQNTVPSMPLVGYQLVNDSQCLLIMNKVLLLDNWITSLGESRDGLDPN